MRRSAVNAWLQRFRQGNFCVEDGHRNGRPPQELDERVGEEVEADPYITCVDIACRLRLPWTRVKLYLQKRSLVNISGRWVRMTEELRQSRIEYCKEMVENYADPSYWDRVIFEGERIIYYNKDLGQGTKGGNVKSNLRCDNFDSVNVKMNSILLRIWWTTGGYVRFRYLPTENRTAADDANELKALHDDLDVQGMGQEAWILHRNNSISGVNTYCPETLAELGWSTMLHPLHCPDLSPTDFHVFLKFLSALNTYNSFANQREIEEFTRRSFDKRKRSTYFREPIAILPEKWHRVIETEGEFIGTHERVD